MEIQHVADKIKENILLLAKTRNTLLLRARQKSRAITVYEKELAKTIMRLRNGEILNIDEYKTPENIPVTLIEKTAKGICYKLKFAMDLSETKYKSAIVAMRAIEVTINAYQSINRYLDEN